MYIYQKKFIKLEKSFLAIFDEIPCTVVSQILKLNELKFDASEKYFESFL